MSTSFELCGIPVSVPERATSLSLDVGGIDIKAERRGGVWDLRVTISGGQHQVQPAEFFTTHVRLRTAVQRVKSGIAALHRATAAGDES